MINDNSPVCNMNMFSNKNNLIAVMIILGLFFFKMYLIFRVLVNQAKTT